MKASSLTPRATPWLFLAPFILLFGIFTAWPLTKSLILSMQQSFGPEHTTFVGARNYSSMFADPLFWTSLKNTTFYTLGSLFIQLPLALGLALLLETPRVRGRGYFRLILFSPSLVGVVFAAMIFGIAFEKKTGLFNQLLHRATAGLGLTPWNLEYDWLGPHVLWAFIIASLWMYVGLNMVYFQAALQNVRRELSEAATVDGAGAWARFRHITIPAIRPVAGFVVLLSVVGSFQMFELPYLMLDVVGRPDQRGMTLVMYLYNNGFTTGDLGYASAVGWVLSAILVLITIVQRLLSRGEQEAEA